MKTNAISRRGFIAGLAGIAAGMLPCIGLSSEPQEITKPGVYEMDPNRNPDKPVNPLELSGKYDQNDFRISYGVARWNRLEDDKKKAIDELFGTAPRNYREKVCGAFFDMKSFDKKYLSRQQRNELQRWERASYWLARDLKNHGKKPNVPLFREGTNLSQVKAEYQKEFPMVTEIEYVTSDLSELRLILSKEAATNYSRINPELRKRFKDIPY